MKSNFEERRENRKARYEELSDKNEQESTDRYNAAKSIGDHIPFGQPILVGHHSEGRHRRDLARIDNNMRKSIEAGEKAAYYAGKAAHIENDKAIYSDDPEAIAKLRQKLFSLQNAQERMKKANKIVRSKKPTAAEKVEQLVEQLGITEIQAKTILDNYGFERYQLSNNNANMTRIKDRIKQLELQENAVTTSIKIGEVEITDNKEDNRVQIFFQGKPSEAVRKLLKSRGFRWSRYIGCWQRHCSNLALHLAKEIAAKYEGEEQ